MTASPATSVQPSATASGPAVAVPTAVNYAARAWPPRPGTVSVVGDSLTVGTLPWLAADFAAAGSPATIVRAEVGIPTEAGLASLARAGDTLGEVVLVALGTNNLQATAADVVDWLDRARAIIGPDRRLVWVNLSMASDRYPNDDVINPVLADSARRDPRLLVLDWAGFAADRGIENTPDGVHYGDTNYRARAMFYTCAVRTGVDCAGYQVH